MLGTKRPARSTLEPESTSHPSAKRLKSNHHHPLEPARPHAPPAATAESWLKPVWDTFKSLIGAPPPSQPDVRKGPRARASNARTNSSRSRQKPVQELSVAPAASPSVPFENLNDAWIWQTMNAKQRGQPPPPEPTVIRELRLRQEKLLASMKRGGGKNSSTSTSGVVGTQNTSTAGAYQRKKPMGSREDISNPIPSTTRRHRSRLLAPEFIRHVSSSPLDTIPVSSLDGTASKRTHRSLYDFVRRTLVVSANVPSSSFPTSSSVVSSSSHSYDSKSSSIRSSSSRSASPQPVSGRPRYLRTTLDLSSPPAPAIDTSSGATSAPRPTFFSSPWLPQSLSRIRRKQHRLALLSRDHSTLESLRSMPNTPPRDVDEANEDKNDNFRVYREGVRNLVEQQDEEVHHSRPRAPSRTTSSLLGPSTTTYASILSSTVAAKGNEPSSARRPRTKLDRTLDNFHKTSTESPAKRMLDPTKPGTKAELFAQFERLRVEQELDAQRALAAEREFEKGDASQGTEVPQRKRKWPKKVPREIQDRVSTILRQGGYDKTIPGAGVDAKAIQRLKPKTWLDDSIIAFYGVLINNRMLEAEETGQWGEREMRLRKVWCFNSFFWGIYEDHGYKRVKKWTKKFDVFEKDIIIFPMNIRNSHWTCAAVNLKLKRFEYYDSLGNRMQKAHNLLRKWLQEEHEAKKGSPLDLSDWEDYWDPNVPQQDNCNDCGVFTCAFMECLSRDVEGFDFDQSQMPYLRQKIAFEIDKGELVPELDFE